MKHVQFLTIVLLCYAGASAADEGRRAQDHPCLTFGTPVVATPVHMLLNPGYVVGYSPLRRMPLWVAYRLSGSPAFTPGPRPARFRRDERIPNPLPHAAYTNSGFDRGHLAPNAAIARWYGPEAQRQTFLMTNVVPQTPRLNRGVWRELEARISEDWAIRLSEVWVLVGPVLEEDGSSIAGGIPVPAACYMIVVDIDENATPHALAVVIPQSSGKRLRAWLKTVDEVEQLTGIDFLTALEDHVEEQVESTEADRRWCINEISSCASTEDRNTEAPVE